eukprot:scaffold4279_cov99-Isochrysis_galbana.AAC.10
MRVAVSSAAGWAWCRRTEVCAEQRARGRVERHQLFKRSHVLLDGPQHAVGELAGPWDVRQLSLRRPHRKRPHAPREALQGERER